MKKTRCPNCKKESDWENNPYRPFCSQRCKLIDLGNWASGKYFIAGEPVSEDDTLPEDTTTESDDAE